MKGLKNMKNTEGTKPGTNNLVKQKSIETAQV
jgi:hypothetical protein